jgi:serine/threonine-protein kinase
MRHVREQVPDVQSRRPEVSAATAAVVERATAVDLGARYTSAAAMIADLEEALAIEAARAGQATGEVTAVLRTLPGSSRRRLPWRMRHPARWAASLALFAAIVALVVFLAVPNTHRGVPPNARAARGLEPVRLSQTAAYSYNPFGTGPENPDQVSKVVDGELDTAWSTEKYIEDRLANKPGVGVYLDAAPGVKAREVEIQTPTPGFMAGIYASNGFNQNLSYGNPTPLKQRGWTLLAPPRTIGAKTWITLSIPTGSLYRYYLVWLVSLPPASESAEISEVTLFK